MTIQYIRSGDYFIPDLELPEETRPIGQWGRMHREYLREHKPIQYNCLLLSGKLWTYLADLNEQAQDRQERMIDGVLKTTGTDVDRLMPPVSRFGGGGSRDKKKQTVIEKLKAFFDNYFGLVQI